MDGCAARIGCGKRKSCYIAIVRGSLVNLVNMVNLVKWLNSSVQGRPDFQYWLLVHWLFFENFYPSLTLGALYAPWLT